MPLSYVRTHIGLARKNSSNEFDEPVAHCTTVVPTHLRLAQRREVRAFSLSSRGRTASSRSRSRRRLPPKHRYRITELGRWGLVWAKTRVVFSGGRFLGARWRWGRGCWFARHHVCALPLGATRVCSFRCTEICCCGSAHFRAPFEGGMHRCSLSARTD